MPLPEHPYPVSAYTPMVWHQAWLLADSAESWDHLRLAVLRQLSDLTPQALNRLPIRQVDRALTNLALAMIPERRRLEYVGDNLEIYACSCCSDGDCNACGAQPLCIERCACDGELIGVFSDPTARDMKRAAGRDSRFGQTDYYLLIQQVIHDKQALDTWSLNRYLTVRNCLDEWLRPLAV